MEDVVENLAASQGQCEKAEGIQHAQQNEDLGWALKKRVERKPLTKTQIAYLLEKYKEGEQTKKKYTGHQVADRMRKEMLVSHDFYPKSG